MASIDRITPRRYGPPEHAYPQARESQSPGSEWIDIAFGEVTQALQNDDLKTVEAFNQWFFAGLRKAPPITETGLDPSRIGKFRTTVERGITLMSRVRMSEEEFGETVNLLLRFRFTDRIAARLLSAILTERVGKEVSLGYGEKITMISISALDRETESILDSLNINVPEDVLTSDDPPDLPTSSKLVLMHRRESKQLDIKPTDIIKTWMKNELRSEPDYTDI